MRLSVDIKERLTIEYRTECDNNIVIKEKPNCSLRIS